MLYILQTVDAELAGVGAICGCAEMVVAHRLRFWRWRRNIDFGPFQQQFEMMLFMSGVPERGPKFNHLKMRYGIAYGRFVERWVASPRLELCVGRLS